MSIEITELKAAVCDRENDWIAGEYEWCEDERKPYLNALIPRTLVSKFIDFMKAHPDYCYQIDDEVVTTFPKKSTPFAVRRYRSSWARTWIENEHICPYLTYHGYKETLAYKDKLKKSHAYVAIAGRVYGRGCCETLLKLFEVSYI